MVSTQNAPVLSIEVLQAQSLTVYYGDGILDRIQLNPGINDFFDEEQADKLIDHPTLALYEGERLIAITNYKEGKLFDHESTGLVATEKNGEKVPISKVNPQSGVAELQKTGKPPVPNAKPES